MSRNRMGNYQNPARASTNEPKLEKKIVAECVTVVAQMGAEMELVGQLKAKGSGTTRGVTDGLLHCAGWTLNVEFKQPGKNLDPDQVDQMVKRLAQGVPTYVVRDKMEMVELINACRRRPIKREEHPLW
jgi:hypothetical protein